MEYKLNGSQPVRYIATELGRAGGTALPISELVRNYRHVVTGDLSRIQVHENTNDPRSWLIRWALRELGDQVISDNDCVRLRNGLTATDLIWNERPVHPLVRAGNTPVVDDQKYLEYKRGTSPRGGVVVPSSRPSRYVKKFFLGPEGIRREIPAPDYDKHNGNGKENPKYPIDFPAYPDDVYLECKVCHEQKLVKKEFRIKWNNRHGGKSAGWDIYSMCFECE